MKRAKAITRVPLLPALLLAVVVSAADTPEWRIETVEASEAGQASSLKVDRDGNLHLCYVLGLSRSLRYGFRDRLLDRWFVMTVDRGANGCTLALDSKQRPHISYADYGSGDGAKLHYAHWDGTAWKTQALPLNSGTIAYWTSIALDADDHPSLSFYEYRGPRGTDIKIRLRSVRWSGKEWEVRTVDADEGSGKVNHMAADARGHLHLAYANVTIGEMRYAYWNGEQWHVETVEGRRQAGEQYLGLSCAVAADRDGNPHVTYMNATRLQQKYAVRREGRWSIHIIDQLAGMTQMFDRSSIAVDDAGQPYISYYDAGRGVLKLAHLDGDRWVAEVVEGNGVGFTSSLQIDRGTIWISYMDPAGNSLKVARRALASAAASTSDNGK
jgi:hypothetical protein